MKKTTKRALLLSALALLLCVSMLVGSTFAWFTDSVSSAGNKIQSGTLKIDLELYDKETDTWNSIKESKTPIFNYDKWEPGYTAVQLLKVENEGNLALKWYAKFVCAAELTELADAIDVYVCPSATELTYPADRDLTGYTKVGTVAEFVNTIETTTYGALTPAGETGSIAYLGIALKMQEEAGNQYQNLDLGAAFDIQILATQHTYETDSFDDVYDVNAKYPGDANNQPQTPTFIVSTATQLQAAMQPTNSNGDLVITITDDLELAAGETWVPLNLDSYTGVARIVINGNGHSIKGLNNALLGNAIFGNTKVEINDLTLDSSVVNNTGDYAGAFVNYSDNAISVTLNNCHLKNSTVASSDYSGGLVGYVSGTITISKCSVSGCTITGESVGSLVGMISVAQGGETATISTTNVSGNTLNSVKNGTYRVGELVGTINIANVALSGITTSGNTCSQPGSTGATSGMVSTQWIGRTSSNVTGDTSAVINH